MASISVAEAAARLGVGVSRVHQRIADGSLRAARIGAQWVIDERSLSSISDSHMPGRPLSERSAWALADLSQSNVKGLEDFAHTEVSRARARLAHLLDASRSRRSRSEEEAVRLLRAMLGKRAQRQLYRASPRDLADMRRDNRVILSGLSDRRSGIASGDLVEGYLRMEDLAAMVKDYLLSEVAVDDDANVVLHVVSARRLDHVHRLPPLLVAADLAEHRSPREEARALELIRDIGGEDLALVPRLTSGGSRGRSKA